MWLTSITTLYYIIIHRSSGFYTLCLPLPRHSFLRAHPTPHHTTRPWQNQFLRGNVPLPPLYHRPEKKTPNISRHLISSTDKRGLKSNQLCLCEIIPSKQQKQACTSFEQSETKLSTCERRTFFLLSII